LAQNSNELFEKANADYRNGIYSEALKTYHEIDKQGQVSADLYYNMGNSYYKLNQIAPSIFYFEKALLLNPSHEDAKHNLVFAQRMTIDAIEILPKSVLQSFNENIIYPISYNSWAWISVVLAFLIAIFSLSYYFSQYATKKRVYFILSFVSIGLFLLVLSFTIKAKYHYKTDQPAIIFSTKVSIKSEPQLSASETFVLHEGTKVQVMQIIDDWAKIKIADGKIGWLLNSDFKKLK
jgi:tetratricopeptide (TPR) repeat protein